MPVTTPPISLSDLATYIILVNGNEIDSSYQVLLVETNSELKQAALARFVLLDGAPDSGFPASDSGTFVPGNTISIRAGYEGKNSSVFEGKISSQELSISRDQASQLTVYCSGNGIDEKSGDTSPVLELVYGDSILDFEAHTTSATGGGVKGTVSFYGSRLAIPGKMISLKGVGKRFSGNTLMTEVNHEIKDGFWYTHVTFGEAGIAAR